MLSRSGATDKEGREWGGGGGGNGSGDGGGGGGGRRVGG